METLYEQIVDEFGKEAAEQIITDIIYGSSADAAIQRALEDSKAQE